MIKRYALVIFLLIILLVITSCKKNPSFTNKNGVMVADSNLDSSDSKQNQKETLGKTDKVKEQNINIFESSKNQLFDFTIDINNSRKIIVNAAVDVEDINTFAQYKYLLEPVSDDLRQNLFSIYFGEESSKVIYDERNNLWEFKQSQEIGDYYLYHTFYPRAGETVSGEESFTLEYRNVDLYPFEDNILSSVDELSDIVPLDESLVKCEQILDALVNIDDYKVDYIHAYGTNGRHPYYKIVYKRMLENTTLTGFNDIYFLVDIKGIQKISGSIFNIEQMDTEEMIITVDKAAEVLKNNATEIDFNNDIITIGKITFEYIVVNNLEKKPEIVPVWRFVIGNAEDQINLYRNKIIAVNALTGELIYTERGDSF